MSSSLRAVQDRLLGAMSAEQKLLASEQLRAAAWKIKAAWITARHPELDAAEVQECVRRLFLDVGA